jgi:hypothetical protein
MDNLQEDTQRFGQGIPAVLHLLCWHARTRLGSLEASMPSYAICGAVEAKPLNVQLSTDRSREGTNKPDIRSDYSVEAILAQLGNAHGSFILPMIAR